jgi:hypothetical protein
MPTTMLAIESSTRRSSPRPSRPHAQARERSTIFFPFSLKDQLIISLQDFKLESAIKKVAMLVELMI